MYWTLDKDGNQVLRDLAEENKNYSNEAYRQGLFDANNYQYYEMFHHYVNEDNGCDYERLGCEIREGDIVLDLGANIGVFANRALSRGAQRVVCFEPITPTFNCLVKNVRWSKGKVIPLKLGAHGSKSISNFKIHTDFTHIGGGTTDPVDSLEGKNIVYEEMAVMMDINDIFDSFDKSFNFMKIDVEGGEVNILNNITDENLSSIRCLGAEFHSYGKEFDEFQDKFLGRMHELGFRTYTLYHSNSGLRTINCWKA